MRRALISLALLSSTLVDCRRQPSTAAPVARAWRWDNPTPTGLSLTSACTAKDGSLVAVGAVGTWLTRRSGEWTRVETGTAANLASVACCPDGRVIAVAEDGTALTQRGSDLRRASLGAPLRAVHCAQDNTVAITDGSQRVHVQRGAAPFVAATVPERFVSITQLGAQWFAGGLSGRLYRADNPAQSWTVAATAFRPILSFAKSGSTALAVGSQGTALLSRDNGAQWSLVSTGSSEDNLAVHHDGTTFRIVGTGGAVRASRDGMQWTAERGAIPGRLLSLARDGARLVAVGDQGLIATLEPAGWRAPEQQRSPIFALHVTDSVRTAIGRSGSILTQRAVGGPWEHRSANVPEDLRAIAVTSRARIIVGDGGVILRSTDQGATWTARESRTTKPLYAVWADESFHALVTGEASLLRSTDGGDTWALTPLPDRWVARTIAYDGQWLWIAGDGAKVLRSRDFGANWEDVSFPRVMRVQKILHRPGQPLLVFTKDNVIVEREGDRWVERAAPSEILFNATQVGTSVYALGVMGEMFRGDGSPLRWSPVPRMTNEGLFALAATPSGALYVAGEFGTVLALR